MKNRPTTVFVLFIFFLTESIAQLPSFKLQWVKNSMDAPTPVAYLGKTKAGKQAFYGFTQNLNKAMYGDFRVLEDCISLFDDGFNHLSNTEVSLAGPSDKEGKFQKYGTREAAIIGGKPFLIGRETEGNDLKLTAYPLDADSKVSKTGNIILSAKNFEYKPMRFTGINVLHSADGKKTIAFETGVTKEGGYSICFAAHNDKINESPKMHFVKGFHDIRSILLSNSGTLYVYEIILISKGEQKKDGPLLRHKIFRVEEDGSEKSAEFTLTNKFIADMMLAEGPDGKIKCVGIYGNEDEIALDGLFSATIQSNASVSDFKTKEFDEDFLTATLTGGDLNAKKKQIERGVDKMERSYRIQDIVPDGEGGFFCIAEQIRYRGPIKKATDMDPLRRAEYMLYGDILIMKMDPTGEIKSIKKVHRKLGVPHGTMETYYKAYALVKNASDIFLLFEDVEKCADNKDRNKYMGVPMANVLCKIEKNGNFTRKNIGEGSDHDGFHIDYGHIVEIGDGKVFMSAFRDEFPRKWKTGFLEIN